MASIVPSNLCEITLILTMVPFRRYYCFPNFTDKLRYTEKLFMTIYLLKVKTRVRFQAVSPQNRTLNHYAVLPTSPQPDFNSLPSPVQPNPIDFLSANPLRSVDCPHSLSLSPLILLSRPVLLTSSYPLLVTSPGPLYLNFFFFY